MPRSPHEPRVSLVQAWITDLRPRPKSGLLLVAVALVVYDRVVSAPVPMVDDSRTAKIFQRTQASIDEQIPEDAPGWIVQRYEQLVGNCGQ